MSKHFTLRIFATLAFLPWGLDDAAAARIIGGSAIFTLNEGLANSIGEFDAYFDDTKERDATLSDPAPGNAPFSETAANPGTIVLTDAVRPFGNVPSPYPGTPGQTRSRQVTTLDFDPADVLGSWEPSNDDYAFVGNSLLGEQIAFTGMQRWSGNFTGVLLYGDFALRYVFDGSSSRLLIASNIDFPSGHRSCCNPRPINRKRGWNCRSSAPHGERSPSPAMFRWTLFQPGDIACGF